MSAETDLQIKLGDGYTVGYAEYGDPQGMPVIYLHGLPSSRLELNHPKLIEIAERLHARMIVPDRPGIGLSEYRPYSIPSYPDLVAAHADKLGLERFPVIGTSSGGKFAAACAWKIPQRLSTTSIVSGSAPFDLPGVRETLSKQDKQVYGLADKMPWLLRLFLWKIARDARKNPASILTLFAEISEVDKATMAQPGISEGLRQMVLGAFQQGTRGAALDWKIEARPWGFSLKNIRMPVDIWHGEQDKLVSIQQARILEQEIPNTHVKYYPDEGHTLFVTRFEDLLSTVVC